MARSSMVGGSGGLTGLYNADKKDFSPRASIAWDLTGKGKTVIRAGYGLFFDAFSQDMMLGHLPYPTFFAPGPAYNNIGPDPIQMANLNPAAVDGNGVYIPECRSTVRRVATSSATSSLSTATSRLHTSKTTTSTFSTSSPATCRCRSATSVRRAIGCSASSTSTSPRRRRLPLPILDCDCINDVSVPRNYGFPYGASYIFQENSTGKSNYNSLQTSLHVTNYHGFMSIVNYVWSKSLDNSSDGEDFVVNAAQPQDSNNPQREYGPSNFNVPHRFMWIFGYEVPEDGRQHAEAEERLGHRQHRQSAERPALHAQLQL